MARLLIVSMDAVGDPYFDQLYARPHFARLAQRAAVHRGVSSVFLTNTYPVHTSVATGLVPARHGLINNTRPFPNRHPRWCYQERHIRAQTLWQAAAQKGLSVAAVMWPVTAGSKTIRYNIPELMAQPGENQVLLNLRHGTKLLQLGAFLRHRRLLNGTRQPARDRFATACMADILRKNKPDLALMHLTAYDSLCHENGLDAPVLQTAFDALDENLGLLLDAAGDMEVILFSDHGQLPAERPILPNELLVERGYLEKDDTGEYKENTGAHCFFECSGGSGFFHPGRLVAGEVEQVRGQVAELPGFGRFLAAEEMATCGRADLPFGFAAQPGYAVEAHYIGEKANHGYPADYDGYQVFWLHAGAGAVPGAQTGGSLLDIAPLAAGILGLDMTFS